MDGSILTKLPGELRNAVYETVLDGTLDVHIDQRGVAQQDPRQVAALRHTCKDICSEVEFFTVRIRPTIESVKLLPPCAEDKHGSRVINVLFDLAGWLNDVGAYIHGQQKKIVLHVGEINVARIPVGGTLAVREGNERWFDTMAAIVDHVPLEGVTRTGVDFSISLVTAAHPLKPFQLTIPLQRGGYATTTQAIAAAMREQRRKLGQFPAKEWNSLTQGEINARRQDLWNLLHHAEYELNVKSKWVNEAIQRVQGGRDRHDHAKV